MPPRATTTSKTKSTTAKTSGRKPAADKAPGAAAGGSTSSRPAVRVKAPEESDQTFGEFTGSRPYQPRSEVDDEIKSRTFQLPVGVVERIKAVYDGVPAKAYDSELEDRIPDTMSGFVVEAVEALSTYYEDLLNDGKEFRRVRRLRPGPGKSGAVRGGQIRSEKAAAKRNTDNQS